MSSNENRLSELLRNAAGIFHIFLPLFESRGGESCIVSSVTFKNGRDHVVALRLQMIGDLPEMNGISAEAMNQNHCPPKRNFIARVQNVRKSVRLNAASPLAADVRIETLNGIAHILSTLNMAIVRPANGRQHEK
jgi:hypothetical protein